MDVRIFSRDIISCEINNGEIVNDGGDENTLNVVGEIGDYIIEIGAPDSDYIEESYSQDKWPKDVKYTKL